MKDIKGYEGRYAATRDGKIWSYKTKRFLKPWLIGRGYQEVHLCALPKQRKYLVHRLVSDTFIKNPKKKEQVNHKNGIKSDNRVENLEWHTNQENRNHAIKSGIVNPHLYARKLTEAQVIEIRQRYAKGERNQRILGDEFKVQHGTIWMIVHRKNWSHI